MRADYRHDERPKLALSYFWPVFQVFPVHVSDVGIAPPPNVDSISGWSAYEGVHAVQGTPAAGGDRGKPWLGAYDISDLMRFGASGIAGSTAGEGGQSGAVPGKGNWREVQYLGESTGLARPFQPQPSARLFPPRSFGEESARIIAGTPEAR